MRSSNQERLVRQRALQVEEKKKPLSIEIKWMSYCAQQSLCDNARSSHCAQARDGRNGRFSSIRYEEVKYQLKRRSPSRLTQRHTAKRAEKSEQLGSSSLVH